MHTHGCRGFVIALGMLAKQFMLARVIAGICCVVAERGITGWSELQV